MFEFTVLNGDYDYDANARMYYFKPLVFTEKKKGAALQAIKEYVKDGTPFTMTFTI